MDDPILEDPAYQVGPYTLTRRLGAGGMGEVWAGRRAHGGGAYKTVAVKLLPPERTHDEASRSMFDDEARLSMLLCNSNIVQVFDVGEDAGICYMAMEWVDGLNLDELSGALRERGELLPLSVVGYIIGELLKALAYAHDFEHEGGRRTIVHRDVSAHNVMISIAGEAKLMDFGIARVASEETSGVHVKGKLRYMPPEQLRGDTREPTLDLFAVGAILHELLEGRRFRSGVVDEARLYGMVLDGEVPPLCCDPERVPAELEVLRSGLLQPRAADRIQSAREAHRYLSAWSGYRDAKFELQDLVRAQVKPAGPQTQLLTRDEPSWTSPSSSRAASRSDVVTAGGTQRPVTSLARASRSTPTRARPLLRLVVGLTAVGVALVVGVVVFVTREVSSLHPGPKAEEAEEVEPLPPASKPPSTPSAEAAPDPVEPERPTPPPASGTTTGADAPPEDPPQATPPPPDDPPKPPPAPRVSVVATAPHHFWIELKIAGRAHEISRMKKDKVRLRLRPGNYRVQYRDDPRGTWRSAGTVTVPEASDALQLQVHKSGEATIR